MENLIHVLPDSVANQIAAGEVIQRPASVVKELVENAIDAGATQIDIALKEAGRNMIRVTDNGKGMSPDDARLAFERHATSKITQATDLFHLRTMGFRGEALASIASVAQVELVTRRPEDELAWKVEIEASRITNEEPTLAAQGCRFTVRNLFYNIPARRKFLGDNSKELKAIRDEFIQIVLVHPELQFSLTHNDEVLYQLPPVNLKQRILALFGKRSAGQFNKQIYPVEVQTQLIRITGFVGDPAAASLRDPMQYFFVNNRFIKHKSFRSAVMKAYEMLIPQGQQPPFFLYFEVDPETLDVNIHPTKTEVKFEHEQAIWPILHATVREALGKAHAVPSIDFDREDAPEIRVFTGDRDVASPSVQYDPNYNPFKSHSQAAPKPSPNWDQLFRDFEKRGSASERSAVSQQVIPDLNEQSAEGLMERPDDYAARAIPFENSGQEAVAQPIPECQALFRHFIAVKGEQEWMVVHRQRAHTKILFERFLLQLELGQPSSQTLLFPEVLPLDPVQRIDLLERMDDLRGFGFDVRCEGDDFLLVAVPSDLKESNPAGLLVDLLNTMHEPGEDTLSERRRKTALRLAQSGSIQLGQSMSQEEMKDLVKRLLHLKDYHHTPDGKPIVWILSEEELLNKF